MRDVPVLVTYDVHTHAMYSADEVERYLQHALDLHDELAVKASFFFPAEAARQMKGTVRELVQRGHQVGGHGLTHRNEYYNVMPAALQKEKLWQATREIEEIIGQRVTFFRAPAFKISGATLRILEELGFEADLSVNSQRLGWLSSDFWNVGWMIAPRAPYHPDGKYPWRKGRSKLWEIPLSCILLAFMSNTGQVFGLAFMRALFRVLHAEARHWEKSIVCMLHPEDLCAERTAPVRPAFGWRDLVPTKDQGVRFRRAFCGTDPSRVAHLSRSLLDFMRGFASVRFVTVPEYVSELNRVSGESSWVARG